MSHLNQTVQTPCVSSTVAAKRKQDPDSEKKKKKSLFKNEHTVLTSNQCFNQRKSS